MAAGPAPRRLDGIHVEDRGPPGNRRGQDRDPDETRLRVARGDGQHRLAPALEPRLARRDRAGRALAYRHREAALQETADAAALMPVERRDAARLEVHPVAAHEPDRAAAGDDRVVE